jgi:prepilin-type N-terminal cleavage/methylation domain-containing protein
MRRQRRGFTLVELAIVIAILGILAVVAIPKYQDMVTDARSAAAKAQLGTVRSAIAISYAKNKGTFPATIDAVLFADGRVPTVDVGTNNVGTVTAGVWSGSAWTSGAPVNPGIGGWLYDATMGRVVINSLAPDPATTLAWSSY